MVTVQQGLSAVTKAFTTVNDHWLTVILSAVNEKLLVTNHDFSKLSTIPDAYLLHEIPEKNELTDEKVDDDLLDKGSGLGEWYSGQVIYRFKSTVSERGSTMRCSAETTDVVKEHE